MPTTVFLSVGLVVRSQRQIPDWKKPTVEAAIDRGMLWVAGVRDYDILVNGESATIYTTVAEGDHIELVPAGG